MEEGMGCYLCDYVTKACSVSAYLSPSLALMKQAARTAWHRTELGLHPKSQEGAESLHPTTNEELNPANNL